MVKAVIGAMGILLGFGFALIAVGTLAERVPVVGRWFDRAADWLAGPAADEPPVPATHERQLGHGRCRVPAGEGLARLP